MSPNGSDTPPKRRRWPRRLAVAAGILLVLVVVGRLVLDPVAAHYTRKALNDAEGIRGAFEDVHVTLFPPGYTIRRLKIIPHPGGSWRQPLLYAERVHLGVRPKALLHRTVVANLRIDEPKVIVAREAPASKATPARKRPPDIGQTLQSLIPLKVERVEIKDGEVLYAENTGKGAPRIWLHGLEVAAENFATRSALMDGRPATLSARAIVQKTGRLMVFASADPMAKGPTFAGRAELRDLALSDLYSLIEPKTDLQATKGTVSVFVDFRARDGVLTGGIKPILKNVEVRPAKPDPMTRLKAWLADRTVELASDRVEGRNAVATIVPLKGRIDEPDVQILPAVLGVVRNAFVVGLTSGFSFLPPPTSPEKESPLEQTKDALTKKKGPPEAQPAPQDSHRRGRGPAPRRR